MSRFITTAATVPFVLTGSSVCGAGPASAPRADMPTCRRADRNAGQRSAIATLGTGTHVPPAPGNLRSRVYSRTAAELFRDRPATPGLRYEVKRDGRTIGSTDGTSLFDDTLAGGTAYACEVTALDVERRPTRLRIAVGDVTFERPWRDGYQVKCYAASVCR